MKNPYQLAPPDKRSSFHGIDCKSPDCEAWNHPVNSIREIAEHLLWYDATKPFVTEIETNKIANGFTFEQQPIEQKMAMVLAVKDALTWTGHYVTTREDYQKLFQFHKKEMEKRHKKLLAGIKDEEEEEPNDN